MSNVSDGGALHGIYRDRIGEPDTEGEVRGYWVFLFGLVLGALGVVLFLPSESAVGASGITLREISIVLLAIGLAMILAGPVIRLPLASWAKTAAYLGQAVCVLAVLWFTIVFPREWSVLTGNQPVIFVYVVGLALIVVGGVIAPLIAGATRQELEVTQTRVARLEEQLASVREERDELETELESTRERLEESEADREQAAADLAEAEAAHTQAAADVDEAAAELSRAREAAADEAAARQALAAEREELVDELVALGAERDDLGARTAALLGQIESLRASQAQFELYEDAGGTFRWRLRHRNGNVVASSGQGYTRKHNAKKGLASVRRNALGASLLEIESEPDEEPEAALEAAPLVPAVEESRAEFDLYEDAGGNYRWRLVHDNGNVIADSGQGYASKQKARQGIESVRNNADSASYLRFDPVSFEVYRDRGGQWRWRLVHKNGNIIAAASEGYSRRRDAKRSVESVRETVGEDDRFEVYEDNHGDHRWRLRAGNNEIVATSGEGYSSKSEADRAVERVQRYAPGADALDVGFAAFEVYEDGEGKWRWRLRHRNGNVIADSGEGYAERNKAHNAIEGVKRNAPGAETVEG